MRLPENRWISTLIGSLVLYALIILVILEVVFWGVWSLARRSHPDSLRAELSPAYSGASWVPEVYREQSARLAPPFVYFPFTVTGVTPWHGKYFNNDPHTAGVWRRTDNPDSDRCREQRRFTVWIFGGSTVYGTGVPDADTLPSYLSHDLNRSGRECVDVTNFGVEGYVSTQELILLTEQLKRGGKPDIVIFYDGFNDADVGMAAVDPWRAHYGFGTVKARVEGRSGHASTSYIDSTRFAQLILCGSSSARRTSLSTNRIFR
jgi:hypothetical protein